MTDPARASRDLLRPESRFLARQFARETMALLKNANGLLPLESNFKKIAVVGPLIHARSELFGCWSPDGRSADVTPLDEALKQIAPAGVQLTFADHADKALHRVQDVDAVVLVVGEYPYRSGENSNVSDLSLPPGQAELVDAVAAWGKPLVLVVLAGRPLAITKQVQQADAVLYAWRPGIEGGVLKKGARVLDLMSSWRSHVPQNMELASLIGLGLNREELLQNPQLTDHVIHDPK